MQTHPCDVLQHQQASPRDGNTPRNSTKWEIKGSRFPTGEEIFNHSQMYILVSAWEKVIHVRERLDSLCIIINCIIIINDIITEIVA
jgi:hypothetical protein